MQGRAPVIYCDAEQGFCGSWDMDYYAATISAVNDVPITMTERAPGWTTNDDGDFCPEHKPVVIPPGLPTQPAANQEPDA